MQRCRLFKEKFFVKIYLNQKECSLKTYLFSGDNVKQKIIILGKKTNLLLFCKEIKKINKQLNYSSWGGGRD